MLFYFLFTLTRKVIYCYIWNHKFMLTPPMQSHPIEFFVLSHSIVVPLLFHSENPGSQKYLHVYPLFPRITHRNTRRYFWLLFRLHYFLSPVSCSSDSLFVLRIYCKYLPNEEFMEIKYSVYVHAWKNLYPTVHLINRLSIESHFWNNFYLILECVASYFYFLYPVLLMKSLTPILFKYFIDDPFSLEDLVLLFTLSVL